MSRAAHREARGGGTLASDPPRGGEAEAGGPAPVVPGPLPRGLPWLLTVGGALGLLAAFALTVERIALAVDPGYTPSCSINPVLSCGSVMLTEQAALFGFPNPLLGIGAFAVVVTIGVALLGRVRLPGWFWTGLLAGALAGTALVHYLVVASLYRIGALCPYCMVVWAVTIPITWYAALAVLDGAARRGPGAARSAYRVLAGYHAVPVVLWFLVVAGLALVRFRDYWVTLL